MTEMFSLTEMSVIAAMLELMQAKKSKTIEQPPIPQTMKVLPRFIFLTYP